MTRTWSDEQNAIYGYAERGEGNLLCRARAGTGKTTTAVELVQRAPEHSVLMAAFNKEIATELQARVPRRGVDAKTLHSLGYGFVRRNWKVRVGNGDRAFNLARQALPGNPQTRLVNMVAKLHTKAREVDPWCVRDENHEALVNLAARFDLMPEEGDPWEVDDVAAAAHRAMKAAMERCAEIDFADMIFLPIAHGWMRSMYEMVLVDEAQDMTAPQLVMAIAACHEGGRVVTLGDDRQAIYQFRGADDGAIDRMKDELHAAELGLKTTYRCAAKIVELAAQIVPDYRAAPGAPDGEVAECDNARMLRDVRPGEFVLSRKNAPLVTACMALLKQGVRAKIRGRDVGAQIVALARRLAASDLDDLEAKLAQWTRRECDRARKRLNPDAADERCANVLDTASVVRAVCDACETLGDFETRCGALFSDDASGGASVMLSSVHRAKGLEADTAYLLRDTFRPGSRAEDNCLYVAITRAKRRLVWVAGGSDQ